MSALTLATEIAPGDVIPIIAIGGGILVALTAIIGGVLHGILRTRAREQSRREIAAYIAEGSMTPDDAERILEAGMRAWEKPRPHTNRGSS